ncbi:DUF2268 domain-containing protein [Bacillus sp. V33-4]|uniref:DUF2268 domain-containing protein n=1 Tax=Bacillus sp. V33-4 TaxID=2054169 RepID=UPI000C75A142|nr:DUF2268 domain-containing protein [Bacillus sp. V33-4]PLR80945.1 hypothetical protein CVD23_20020 [Bacillus sp. V33-4]
MGIINTDEWMMRQFDNPVKICSKFADLFENDDPKNIYEYLLEFGMYRPGRTSKKTYLTLLESKIWTKVGDLFNKYKKFWNGPDVPVFIFPINEENRRLMKETDGKAGVSFKDKVFLFLSPGDDIKEIEALFVHEYHHVCRMHKIKKPLEKYTLLDSIIMEGLAEEAVNHYCGKKYIGNWCYFYSEKELVRYWDKYVSENLDLSRNNTKHDMLLFGTGPYPRLLGYAIGYQIISDFKKEGNFSIKRSLVLPANRFLDPKN